MRLCYVLLSSTFGMHQYTADIANRMEEAGNDVYLVTSKHFPRDRYSPKIQILTPIDSRGTGLSFATLRLNQLNAIARIIVELEPDVVHMTGPHLWNTLLIGMLKKNGLPVIHTIHDVDPHEGQQLGGLLRFWNWSIIRSADKILVHGQRYKQALIDRGVSPNRVWMTPLLHLFLDYQTGKEIEEDEDQILGNETGDYVLFFGRLEAYKGLENLIATYAKLAGTNADYLPLTIAGEGDLAKIWAGAIPDKVEIRNRRILDEEAVRLFEDAALIILPYTSATQSALVAAAYFFHKPVLVADSGALAENVQQGATGFIVEPGDDKQLAQSILNISENLHQLRQMGNLGRVWYDKVRQEELEILITLYKETPKGLS